MHTFVWESWPFVFKDFRVSLAVCIVNFHLEHSFYIDIKKNIVSYFNILKMLFVILLPISCKKKGNIPYSLGDVMRINGG